MTVDWATKLRWYNVSTEEGLRLAGQGQATGRVMLTRPVTGQGLGYRKRSHFHFTKKGERYMTRAGELNGARVTEYEGKVILVQFNLAWFE